MANGDKRLMVTKVVIRDNKKAPIGYLSELKAFKNGKEFVFKEGVNIIVGENGSGKTTLMNLIRKYLMVDAIDCDRGKYNSNINDLFDGFGENKLLRDGVDVYADYVRNTFRLVHKDEKVKNEARCAEDFIEVYHQAHSSTGEGVVIALNSLFNYMFGGKDRLVFNYAQFEDNYKPYVDYIADHIIKGNEWTVLMDEPDRNLSLDNISHIKTILSFHKEKTQIIAVIHNPLLIYSLSKNKDVNIIEMSKGYVKKVIKSVNEILDKS